MSKNYDLFDLAPTDADESRVGSRREFGDSDRVRSTIRVRVEWTDGALGNIVREENDGAALVKNLHAESGCHNEVGPAACADKRHLRSSANVREIDEKCDASKLG